MTRLFSLLLSLCVLTGSVGAVSDAWQCRMSGEPTTVSAPCCAEESADQAAADGCCSVKVAYDHVTTDSVGPVFTLDWPAPAAWLSAVPTGWRLLRDTALFDGPATVLYRFAADSGPPGRAVGWALVVALHQLRV